MATQKKTRSTTAKNRKPANKSVTLVSPKGVEKTYSNPTEIVNLKSRGYKVKSQPEGKTPDTGAKTPEQEGKTSNANTGGKQSSTTKQPKNS